jgi:HNH endonuclease
MQIELPESPDKWDCIVSRWVKPIDDSRKSRDYVGQRSPRTCRFCGGDETSTTFRSDAHVIPAAFGNRLLFSYDECDECNQRIGSVLENDLANYLSVARALSRLPARGGSRKIKSASNQQVFLQGRPADNQVYAYLPTESEGIKIHDDGKALHLSIDIPKHRPINVAKAIARMSLFCLDQNYDGYRKILDWVCGNRDLYPVSLLTLHWPGTGYNAACCSCHKYVDPKRNILRFEFLYSSFLTVVPIPLDDQPLPTDFTPLEYPAPIKEMMLENSSGFLIRDDRVEAMGTAYAHIPYAQHIVEDRVQTATG